MNKLQAGMRRVARKLVAGGLLIVLAPLGRADIPPAHNCNLDEYRAHLAQLQQVVEQCEGSADFCKPDAVGPDDLVGVQGRVRRVDYGWLRASLSHAGRGAAKASAKDGHGVDEKKQAGATLAAAMRRLHEDDAQAALLAANRNDPMQSTVTKGQPVLRSVLAASEFHTITQPSLWERIIQRFFEWLDSLLRGLGAAGGLSKNLVRLLVYGSILICLTLLVWWYARQIRQQRIALVAATRAPHPSAASAVDWRQRLQQAQALAAAGDRREAVHMIYWAAISRLESLGNWPADRARTPREYLQLLPASHRKRPDLALLTRSFEGIWYGRRSAGQADFDGALSLLERLATE
jgi:hypothetical protein